MASRRELIQSELLILQYLGGNSRALESLVTLWYRPVYSYVRQLLRSEEDAKDVTQDIWFNVVRKLRTLREPAAFPAWLFKTARMRAATHFRGARLLEPLPEDTVASLSCSDMDSLSSMIDAEELHWALSQLSAPHSECLILHFLEGFSIKEIADITGIAAGTIKSRIHYARQALREALKKETRHDERSQS